MSCTYKYEPFTMHLSDSYADVKVSPMGPEKCESLKKVPPTSTPLVPTVNGSSHNLLDESYLDTTETSFHIYGDDKSLLPRTETNKSSNNKVHLELIWKSVYLSVI